MNPTPQSDTPRTDAAINTNVRLFDLVRFMRSELHKQGLITEEEYVWLCSSKMATSPQGGSPSPRRLEDYDQLQSKLAEANKRLDYVRSIGMVLGYAKSSDKPEPYLAHDWTETSDQHRIFTEWSHSIGWEDTVKKLQEKLAAAQKQIENLECALRTYRKFRTVI